jgi:glycosyltransferase involved in cell wall biosynthesis
MDAEVDYDRSRVIFIPRLPYDIYLTLLRVSAAHVYLTWPFVASWSLVEAMSTGCAIVGSDTPPVREFVRHGENGLLVDFFDPEAIAAAVASLLGDPAAASALRAAARRTVVEHYPVERSLAEWNALIARVASAPLQQVPAAIPAL